MKKLGKYSIGIGDRFGHQGHAQLSAIIEAGKKGVEITPVWNKSNREHMIIGTGPADVRAEADHVTAAAGFKRPYFVDADHINYDNVDRFIASSDFFTIDVASFIGKRAPDEEIDKFVARSGKYTRKFSIEGIRKPVRCSHDQLSGIAEKYLFAAQKAGQIYRKIKASRGSDNFVTEISMDEVASPQSPLDMLFILMMLSDEMIPVQTIAPKFSGRFNKGVDYVGDPEKFAEEFESDLLVTDFAVKEFGLPENLKLSVHSGSDKFSIYGHINSLMTKHGKGIHLKTAGTTWLEEVIGLAEAGGEALEFVREIYTKAHERIAELCAPYADVIDIEISSLPSGGEVASWNAAKFASSLRHDQNNPNYNRSMRQLIHVAYKLAASEMERFFGLLDEHQEIVGRCVYENLYNRHITKIFGIR